MQGVQCADRVGVVAGEAIGEQSDESAQELPAASAASIRLFAAVIASSRDPTIVSAMTKNALVNV